MRMSVEVRQNDKMFQLSRQYPKAAASALTKLSQQLKTEASKVVREELRITKKGVDKTFQVIPARPTNLVSIMKSTGKRTNLVDFNARQMKAGVKATIATGKQVMYPHAFIATMKSGHIAVFLRRTSATHRKVKKYKRIGDHKWGRTQLPIFEVTGPSIPTILASPSVKARLQQFIKTKLPELLKHEIEFFQR